MLLLVGDIGGTKTVLALISPEQGVRQPLRQATFPSDDYESLEAVIADFLQETDTELVEAVFGVAGPVVGQKAQITNLPWVIDATVIAHRFNIETVRLLNDLEAIAHAVPHLQADDLFVLNTGTPEPEGALAVIAPGTGLGEAFLVWNDRSYSAYPSEGGHAAFAPVTAEQTALLAYLQPKMGYVSFERVCAGIGIPNLYDFLRHSGRFPDPPWLQEALAEADDKTPLIVEAAVTQTAEICVATLDLFMEILGAEAGNLALKVLATGGVYIGGGIPPRILSQLQESRFMATFTNKGRFVDLLQEIPVQVICNPQTALYGVAHAGLEDIGNG